MRKPLTVIGLIFLTFLFMVLVITYTLAEPIDSVYESLLGSDMGETVNPYRDSYIPYYRTATIMAFALAVAGPFGYFIAEIFSREPDIDPYYRQRRFR